MGKKQTETVGITLGAFRFRKYTFTSISNFPTILQKLLILIIPFLFACTTKPEGCGSGYTDITGKCYNQSDLEVLQDFIDNSSGTIKSSLDSDSSGTIDPLELQFQRWNENGRLTFLW